MILLRSRFLCRGDGYAISVAGRLGDHKEARIFTAAIEYLMRYLGGHGKPGERREAMLFISDFEGELARQHVEELRCVVVQMTFLGGAGRHALFDNAQVFGAMEVPAVAELISDGAGPVIVLGSFMTDGLHHVQLNSLGVPKHPSC